MNTLEQENSQDVRLLGALEKSKAFSKNKINYIIFYSASFASVVMFIIILILLSYSLSVGKEVHSLTTKGKEILDNVQTLLPIVERICQHANFTKTYGNICHM